MWNATYIVRGRQAIFGAYQLWCALNHIEVKINRIGESFFRVEASHLRTPDPQSIQPLPSCLLVGLILGSECAASRSCHVVMCHWTSVIGFM